MLSNSFVFCFAIFICVQKANVDPSIVGISTSAAISLSNPDLVLAQSVIYSPHVRGSVGERHMHTYISRNLRTEWGVRHVPIELGRQGIDGVYVRYGPDGYPNSLVVSEAKFGSSQLGITKDGVQLSKEWTSRRLAKISDNYQKIADQVLEKKVIISPIPDTLRVHRLQVQMPDGRAAVFWKRPSEFEWKFAGKASMLDEAGLQYQKMASLFNRASLGKIDYPKYLFKVQLRGGVLVTNIYQIFDLPGFSQEIEIQKLASISTQLVGSNFVKIQSEIEKSITDQLLNKLPSIGRKEAELQAREIIRNQKNLEELLTLKKKSFLFVTAKDAIAFGAIQALFEGLVSGGLEYYFTSKVDAQHLAVQGGLAFISGAAGYSTGQYVASSMIQSRVIGKIIPSGTTFLGTSARSLAAKSAASALGGGVAVAIFSYGNFLMGYSSIDEAHRGAIIGLSSVGLGAAGGAGIMGAAIAFGTAGSGAAISSLSGAAATNAALAYLGGGTIAAGGGGMAAGAVVLSGGTVLIAIGGGVAGHYVFKYYDEQNEINKLNNTMGFVRKTNHHFSVGSIEEQRAIGSIGYWKQNFANLEFNLAK